MQIDTAFITEAIDNASTEENKCLLEAMEMKSARNTGFILMSIVDAHLEALEEETRDNPSQGDMEKELNEDADRAGIN